MRLDLDYAVRRSSKHLPGLALLAVAAALAVWLGLERAVALREADTLQGQLDRVARKPNAASRLDPRLAREVRQANEVLVRMSAPWERLFAAIEAASNPRIALLALNPDPKSGKIELTGEAAERAALVEYLDALRQQPALKNVYLLSEQATVQGAPRALRFVVTATWTEARLG
jgi:Tfp pilus assembly protein PilN